MEKVLFKEEQRYKKPRILYIMTAAVVVLVIDITFLIRHILYDSLVTPTYPYEATSLIIVTVLLVLFTAGFLYIFTRMKLITRVNDNGLQVFYPPLLKKGRTIAKEEIEGFEIRQYNPIREFGGWGIKPRARLLRRKKTGVSYTAYGRTGVQLWLRNGKKILIGTQRPEPFRYALARMLEAVDNNPENRLQNLKYQTNG